MAPVAPTVDEAALVAALRRREEAAFAALVRRYSGAMLRLAVLYTRTRAVAEEVVQEAWLGVLQGIDRFEGRSSFKTWLFRILVNRARTRAAREARTIPFSAVFDRGEPGGAESAVPPERFRGPADPLYPFHWGAPPHRWGESPEERVLSQETLDIVERAIAALPPAQREVVTLRDVEGWTAEEVCNVLEISDTNQRVVLHRGRSRVRAVLERHLDPRVGEP
jgi:RNA polymerase sigma-70 factor (ECF subfamily)